MESEAESPRRWGWILLGICALILLLLIGAHWVWSTGAERRLEKQAAAYRAAGEPIELADFVVRDVRDDDNAALLLQAAGQLVDPRSPAWQNFDQLSPGLPLTEKEAAVIQATLDVCGEALAKTDEAMQKRGVDWKLAWKSPAILLMLPDLSKQRKLATLLRSAALLEHQRGHDAAAVRHLERLIFMAKALDGQPVVISNLVATGIRALAADCAGEIAPDLKIGGGEDAASPAAVKELIASLREDASARAGLHLALQGERAMQLDSARGIANGTMNPGMATAGPPTGGLAVAQRLARPMALADGLLMIRHTTAMIDAVDKSPDWPGFERVAPATPIELDRHPIRHMVARIFLPSLHRAVETNFRGMTERRLAAAALAMRWYAVDHGGKFPATLEELVPKYLPAVPLDAMSAGGAIKYVADESLPKLYSVGEDGIDQGGDESTKRQYLDPSRWQTADAVMHLTRRPRVFEESDSMLSGVDAESLTTQPATTQSQNQ